MLRSFEIVRVSHTLSGANFSFKRSRDFCVVPAVVLHATFQRVFGCSCMILIKS